MKNKKTKLLFSILVFTISTLSTNQLSAQVYSSVDPSSFLEEATGGSVTTELYIENTSDETIRVQFGDNPYVGNHGYYGTISPMVVDINEGSNYRFTVQLPLPDFETSFYYSGEYTVKSGSNTITFDLPSVHMHAYEIIVDVPTGLTSSNISNNSFTLTWNSTGATSYEVYKNGSKIGSPQTNSFNVTGLSTCTSYSMTVVAVDANGNSSAPSSALNVTTGGCCPTDLTLTVNSNLSYLASNSITASNVISSGDVHYGANNSVRMLTGFKVNSGVHFLADLNGCTQTKSAKAPNSEMSYGIEKGNIKTLDDITLYPNPSTGLIHIKTENDEPKQLQIYSTTGALVYSLETSEINVDIDLTGHARGMYIARIISGKGITNKRFIIE